MDYKAKEPLFACEQRLFNDQSACFFLSHGLLQPVLPVHKTGNKEADHIVTSSVDHGGRGIHQITDGNQNGERIGNLLREEMEQMMYSPM